MRFVGLIVLILFGVGCGVKAPPLPPIRDTPQETDSPLEEEPKKKTQ